MILTLLNATETLPSVTHEHLFTEIVYEPSHIAWRDLQNGAVNKCSCATLGEGSVALSSVKITLSGQDVPFQRYGDMFLGNITDLTKIK